MSLGRADSAMAFDDAIENIFRPSTSWWWRIFLEEKSRLPETKALLMLDALISASLLVADQTSHPTLFFLPWNDPVTLVRFSQLEKDENFTLRAALLRWTASLPMPAAEDYATAYKNSSTSGNAQQDTALGDAEFVRGSRQFCVTVGSSSYANAHYILSTLSPAIPASIDERRKVPDRYPEALKVSDKDTPWWKWFCAEMHTLCWNWQLRNILQELVGKLPSYLKRRTRGLIEPHISSSSNLFAPVQYCRRNSPSPNETVFTCHRSYWDFKLYLRAFTAPHSSPSSLQPIRCLELQAYCNLSQHRIMPLEILEAWAMSSRRTLFYRLVLCCLRPDVEACSNQYLPSFELLGPTALNNSGQS